MSLRDDLQERDLRPLLKPYGGAGAPPWRRHVGKIVALLAAALCVIYGFTYALTTPYLLVPFMSPLAILLLVVIWVAPEARTIPIKPLEYLFFALFMAFVIWPNYLAISLPGLPWITVSRLFGTPLVLLFLVSVSSNAKLRRDLAAILSAAPLFWKGMVVMIVMQIVSLPFSSHFGGTISRLVLIQTTETAPFFLACYLFARQGRPTFAVFTLWAMVIAVSVMGLLEAPQRHSLWAGHIPSFLKIESETVARIIAGGVRTTTGQYRMQAVFSTALGLSEYLGMVTPFILHLVFWKALKPWVRIAAAATLPLILIIIIGTDSRFGLMVYFISAMLYLLSWALLQRRRANNLIGTAIVMAYPVLFALGVAASFVIGRVRAKVWGTGQYDNSTAARVEQFDLAFPKIFTHPLGHGLGMGADAIGYYTPGGLLSVDSYYLSLVMELGIIGLTAFLVMFIYLGLKAFLVVVRSYDENSELSLLLPAAISVANFLFIKLVFAQEDNHPLMFVIAGMIVALLYRSYRVSSQESAASRSAARIPS